MLSVSTRRAGAERRHVLSNLILSASSYLALGETVQCLQPVHLSDLWPQLVDEMELCRLRIP
jgi:hypothetical protein